MGRDFWTTLGLACALGAPAAHAQEATRAHLLTAPDAQMLSDVFPVIPLANGVSGRVVLACDVTDDGGASCHAADETPAGQGFGVAAEKLALNWRFAPATQSGQPAPSAIQVSIVFQNASDTPLEIFEIDADGAEGIAHLPPSGDAVNRFYPSRAREEAIDGRALVACITRSDQQLDCAIEREAPEGYEFGAQALAMLLEEPGSRSHLGPAFRVVIDFAMHDRFGTRWDRFPTGRDFEQYYPRPALRRGIEGRSAPWCTIQIDRTVVCAVGPEEPAGEGFGLAAAHIAMRFRVSAVALGRPGLAVGDQIGIPISFRISR